MDEFFAMSKDEAPENIPMMLLTFPSAKDPTSQIRHPGNINFFKEVALDIALSLQDSLYTTIQKLEVGMIFSGSSV